MNRVLVAGTFDGLHPGHVRLLNHAKQLGGKLTVIVARDSNVEKIKGKPPLFNENERLELVSALKMVDETALGGQGDFLKAVVSAEPEIVVLGHDQKYDEKELERALLEKGLCATVVRGPEFDRKRFGSSKLKLEGDFGEKL